MSFFRPVYCGIQWAYSNALRSCPFTLCSQLNAAAQPAAPTGRSPRSGRGRTLIWATKLRPRRCRFPSSHQRSCDAQAAAHPRNHLCWARGLRRRDVQQRDGRDRDCNADQQYAPGCLSAGHPCRDHCLGAEAGAPGEVFVAPVSKTASAPGIDPMDAATLPPMPPSAPASARQSKR